MNPSRAVYLQDTADSVAEPRELDAFDGGTSKPLPGFLPNLVRTADRPVQRNLLEEAGCTKPRATWRTAARAHRAPRQGIDASCRLTCATDAGRRQAQRALIINTQHAQPRRQPRRDFLEAPGRGAPRLA